MQPVSTASRPAAQAAIHADLIGTDACAALGVTVRGSSPVLALCRRLTAAGHPDQPLHAYRGRTLCLIVTSISAAARLEVNGNGSGFRRCPAPVGIASPVRFGGRR